MGGLTQLQPTNPTNIVQGGSPQLFARAELKTTTESTADNPLSESQLEALMNKALANWDEQEKTIAHLQQQELAPLLYQVWKQLNAPGRKGQGFSAWLKRNKRSRATAYRLVTWYAEQHGLPAPPDRKRLRHKCKALSQVRQGCELTEQPKSSFTQRILPQPAPAQPVLADICDADEDVVPWQENFKLDEELASELQKDYEIRIELVTTQIGQLTKAIKDLRERAKPWKESISRLAERKAPHALIIKKAGVPYPKEELQPDHN